MPYPIVQVSGGKLKGKVCLTPNQIEFFTFKGVPYAKPPTGELRFSIPATPEPWDGVRDATKDCNICPQFDKMTNSVVGDEDCLYLNVFTPQLPSPESYFFPVMVFIHGGGFVFGNGTDDEAHGADHLIENNVVVVSINYRLGVFGFLSLDRKEAPGNMGLRDQMQALRWVKENIDKFNGDPNNVTIFGASAGAAAVEYLMLSPMTKGLFHKAVAQSGSSILHWAMNKNVKGLSTKISLLKEKVFTDDDELLKFLKGLSTKDLVHSSMQVIASLEVKGSIAFGFVPTIEKPGDWEPFLDKEPYELLSRGEFNKVPYLSGFCNREGLLCISHSKHILEDLIKEKNFVAKLPFKVDDSEKIEIENKLKTLYLEKDSKFKDADSYAIDFFTDVDIFSGVAVAAKMIAKHAPSFYLYEFSYDGGLNYLKTKHNINREGAAHNDECGYLIRSHKLDKSILTDMDIVMKKRMVEMWTNFAKFGDPTPEINALIPIKWEPVADTGLVYLNIDKELTMNDQLYPEKVKFYQGLFEKEYSLIKSRVCEC